MQDLKYQLHKTLRHEEALMRFYRNTIDDINNSEVKKYFLSSIQEKEKQVDKIKGLLKKYCSS